MNCGPFRQVRKRPPEEFLHAPRLDGCRPVLARPPRASFAPLCCPDPGSMHQQDRGIGDQVETGRRNAMSGHQRPSVQFGLDLQLPPALSHVMAPWPPPSSGRNSPAVLSRQFQHLSVHGLGWPPLRIARASSRAPRDYYDALPPPPAAIHPQQGLPPPPGLEARRGGPTAERFSTFNCAIVSAMPASPALSPASPHRNPAPQAFQCCSSQSA